MVLDGLGHSEKIKYVTPFHYATLDPKIKKEKRKKGKHECISWTMTACEHVYKCVCMWERALSLIFASNQLIDQDGSLSTAPDTSPSDQGGHWVKVQYIRHLLIIIIIFATSRTQTQVFFTHNYVRNH